VLDDASTFARYGSRIAFEAQESFEADISMIEFVR